MLELASNICWKSSTHLLAVVDKEGSNANTTPKPECYQGHCGYSRACRPLCTQPGASSRQFERQHQRMHTAGQYLVACLITITNEVWLQILSNRGTDPQLSANLAEYGIIRRRHRRIIKNNLYLHRHLHRRILAWNLNLHAHRNRETLSRNQNIHRTYMRKYRSLLRYQPNYIFNPYPAFRHHNLLPIVPPWVPHLPEWSGPSLSLD